MLGFRAIEITAHVGACCVVVVNNFYIAPAVSAVFTHHFSLSVVHLVILIILHSFTRRRIIGTVLKRLLLERLKKSLC